MHKAFKYIEEIWLGTDGKPSIKRIMALVCFVVVQILVIDTVWTYLRVVKAVLKGEITEPAQVISAVVSGITQIGIIIGALLAFIAGLLSLTGYLNLKQQEINPPTSQMTDNQPTTEANTSAHPQID